MGSVNLEVLKDGERLFIDISENICNSIELYDIKIQSYQNLFNSYMSNTIEEASEFNLKKFLNTYSEIVIKQEVLIRDTIIDLVGIDSYSLLYAHNGYRFVINRFLKKLVIFRN